MYGANIKKGNSVNILLVHLHGNISISTLIFALSLIMFTAERPLFSVYCWQEHFLSDPTKKNLNKLISIYRTLLISYVTVKGSTAQ